MPLSKKEAMALAIKEAKKALGLTHPNPPVGACILDKDFNLLSTGCYSHFGAPHAEVQALRKIKDKKKLEGAHMFVTLEPCAHFGKNPPCVDALLEYPLSSVNFGLKDPNP